MNVQALKEAVALAERLQHVFVATADATGLPHAAASGRLTSTPKDHVSVTAWFCPATVANLEQNPRIAIVIWDASADVGYQLLGGAEKIEELGILNGYVQDEEGKWPLPQVERRLLVRVDRVMDFKHAPHSDVEK